MPHGAMQPRSELTPNHLAMLGRSFVTPELAKRAQLSIVDEDEGAMIVGQARKNGRSFRGYKIPFFWPGEAQPREYQLRRDQPDIERDNKGIEKETKKYLMPPGRGNLLYFVPGTDPSLLKDASLPVAITEGAKKALALEHLREVSNFNILPVALIGVWNWKGNVGKTTASNGERVDVKGVIPDLDEITWENRTTYIVFDANASTNSSVEMARQRLSEELAGRGADVRIVEVPVEDGVNGIDDFLGKRANEDEAARDGLALFNSATPFGIVDVKAEPIPIPDLLPVPKIDASMLPSGLREWVADISRRRGCAMEYPALSALVAAGALIGTKIGIRPKVNDTFFVFPNLYGLAVGESGSQKSDGLKDGLQFVEEIQDENWDRFEAERPANEAARYDREAELNALEADLKSYYGGGARKSRSEGKIIDREATQKRIAEIKAVPTPTPERIIIEDATVEKIGELLNENSRGLLSFNDEISALLDTFQMKDRKQDRAFYLKGWNGTGTHTVDRIGRGSMRIKNMCLSVMGGTQPSKISGMVDEVLSGRNDDGLLQRFGALVFPDALNSYEYVDDPPRAVQEARRIFRKLNELDPATEGFKRLTDDAGGYFFLQFDAEAQVFFRQWITDLENNRRAFVGFVGNLPVSHISKFRGLMPKLALIFQLIDYVSGEDSRRAISIDNARLAAEWCEFFTSHASRLYGSLGNGEFTAAKRVLTAIKSGEIQPRFTPREIQQKGWSALTSKESINSALNVLEEYHWVRRHTIKTGGRPSTVFIFQGTVDSPTKPTKDELIDDEEAEAVRLEACGAL